MNAEEWFWEIGRLVIAAGIGFGSAQLALWSDRRRIDRLADADWELTAIDKAVAMRGGLRGWVLKNTGTKTATRVELSLPRVEIIRDPEASTVFRPGESELIMVDTQEAAAVDASKNLNITWYSHRGEKKETSRLLEIPY